MEVIAPIARSSEFHFNNTSFSPVMTSPSIRNSFGYQYHYSSAPASPAQAAAIQSHITAWAHPTPTSRHLNEKFIDVFDFALSPRRYNQPIALRGDKLFEKQLRVRGYNSANANSLRNRRRRSRSLSPLREVGLLAKNESPSANPMKCGLSKKWPRLKNLLQFRSASVGRTTGRGSKDPMQKYTNLAPDSPVNKEKGVQDRKAGGGVDAEKVRRGRKPAVSPHEKHYMENRAAAEELKWKTPLPFQRQGLISFIDFSPAIRGKSKEDGVSPFPKAKFSNVKKFD